MKGIVELLKKAHADEQGAEMVEKVLIVAAIVLPLLGLLLFFKEYISEWVRDEADTVRQESDAFDPDRF